MNSDIFHDYYRKVSTYVPLPSGTTYYTDQVIDFTDNGEVGIRAMTSDDEIILKNPDALLNGEAVTTVLKSCVDGLKKPLSLLTNDVDALLTAIRVASYGKETDFTSVCGKCTHENTYAINLEEMLANCQSLDDEYIVKLSSGLNASVRPFTYNDKIKMMKLAFEQEKVQKQLINANAGTEEVLKVLNKSIKKMTALNAELIAGSIYRLHDDEANIDLYADESNRANIIDLLKNIEIRDAKSIETEVKKINGIGIDTNVTIKCDECENTWSSQIETNPVNFSTGS